MSIPTTSNTTTNPYKSDVLQSKGHMQMSAEEIAKAVARHNRQHPNKMQQPTKTAPRG